MAGLTVDRICAEAGIKQRTFFNHFATKEDAILGRELPRLDEQRVREYLAATEVGVLTGALRLVVLPGTDDPADTALAAARFEVLSTSPALAERQAVRMLPLVGEVQAVVRLKLRQLEPEASERSIDDAAAVVTQLGASLMLSRAPGRDPVPPEERVASLAWVWDKLL